MEEGKEHIEVAPARAGRRAVALPLMDVGERLAQMGGHFCVPFVEAPAEFKLGVNPGKYH